VIAHLAAPEAADLTGRSHLRGERPALDRHEGAVATDELGVLAMAKSLLDWHRRHRFCSACGAPSTLAQAGFRRDCTACGTQHFPRTDPVVIMLVSDGDHCLLGASPLPARACIRASRASWSPARP
jgi:NAD+ diphosphatase